MPMSTINVVTVTNDGDNASYFGERRIELHGTPERMLSEQQTALNFRLRTSASGYLSGWHTAGDPTLLIILQGEVEIELRNGSAKRFSKGELFVAQDYLAAGVLETDQHGHRARLIGEDDLIALHLKLSKR